jgi:ABC-type uncharacterized transport system substrate-binding protein
MKRILSLILGLFMVFTFSSLSLAADFSGKKVLFIDSYHEGYGWSDGITQGIQDVVGTSGAELKIHRMDTKKNPGEDFKKAAALKAKALIEAYKPDVVIASDDNASKFLIMPYYKNADLPFVFCGVNWDATGYGFPYKNTTGMLEVTPVPQLIEQLEPFAKGNKIGFIGPDILTAKKEVENLKKTFNLELTTFFATDYENWKKGFKELQQTTDMIIIDRDGGIYKEHAADMKAFVEANTTKPTGASYDFMAPYALITYGKVAQEQGQWAGQAALKILSGTAPSAIPFAKNEQGQLIINARIANALGVEIPFEILEAASSVIE